MRRHLSQVSSDPVCTSLGCGTGPASYVVGSQFDPYNVPNLGLDHEIKSSLENMKSTEKSQGNKEWLKTEDPKKTKQSLV